MQRVSRSTRARVKAKRLDMATVRASMGRQPAWVYLGIVVKPADQTSHWSMDTDETGGPLIWVQFQPTQEEVECRLGGLGGGPGDGVWRIPPIGTEVMVLTVDGDLNADPAIVAVLSSGATPGELTETTLVVRAPTVTINADAGDCKVLASGVVHLGDDSLTTQEGVVNGLAVDSFTGSTQFALGNASTKVRAK